MNKKSFLMFAFFIAVIYIAGCISNASFDLTGWSKLSRDMTAIMFIATSAMIVIISENDAKPKD